MTLSNAYRTIGLAVGIALSQAACAAEPGASSRGGTASPDASRPAGAAQTPSAECINPPRDLLTLINQTDPVACYGDTPLTVDAEVYGVGAIDCAQMEPAWMACGAWVTLVPIAGQAGRTGFVLAATTGPNARPEMFAAIHPETNLESRDIMGRPLRITGHYDDPAAQTCQETQAPFGEATTPPQQVIKYCRNLFVLTAFEQL
jgi:hypothetical protein